MSNAPPTTDVVVSADDLARRRELANRAAELDKARKNHVRSAGRDLGELPKIASLDRRKACQYDFRNFCLTYNPRVFYLDFSPIHEDAIKRIEECVLHGAKYAYAMPRGSGKSSLAKTAAWWALSYAHRKYVYLIGATGSRSQRLLDSIKIWMRFNRPYIDDFPEVSVAIAELKGRGNGATGQLQHGRSTMIGWTKDMLVLPTVTPPSNFPYQDYGMDSLPDFVPTSGHAAACSGLTGDGIRGNAITTSVGDEVRPDLVLADDPQTDRSAASPTQNLDRYDLMTGAVLGMAGPDKNISLLMPCTIIKKGDMVSRCLDRKRSPLFRGQTTSILQAMPVNMGEWEKYFERYHYGMLQEPPTMSYANQFYEENRELLEEGCVPTWPQRMQDNEVSAIQHAMNLYALDRKTFFAEYMNQPVDAVEEITFLTSQEIVQKQHRYKRLECPIEVTKVVVFCDVQKEFLIWSMVGFTDQFSGYLLDYGTYPEQAGRTWEKSKTPDLLTRMYPDMSEDGRLYRAITDFIDAVFKTRISRPDDGTFLQVDLLGIDRGYKPTTVLKAIRDSRERRVVPVRGGAWKATDRPMDHPDNIKRWTAGGRRLGPGWRLADAQQGVQSIETEPSRWKTFLHEHLAVPLGEPGSISIYQESNYHHHLLAEHLTAEYRTTVDTKWGKRDTWQLKPSVRDNDYLDCLSNCCMLASFLGIKTFGTEETGPRVSRKIANPSRWGMVRGKR